MHNNESTLTFIDGSSVKICRQSCRSFRYDASVSTVSFITLRTESVRGEWEMVSEVVGNFTCIAAKLKKC